MAAKYSERPVGVDVLIDPCREAAKGRRAADCRPYEHAFRFFVGAGFIPARRIGVPIPPHPFLGSFIIFDIKE